MQHRFFSLIFAATLAGLCFVACSGESEGQRCELTDDNGGPDNSPGSSDCSGNLVCYAGSKLGGQASQWAAAYADPNFGICCPLDRTKATTSICSNQPAPPNSDAAPPVTTDSGPTNDAGDTGATSDSGDAANDSSSDSPSDAPADAPDAG